MATPDALLWVVLTNLCNVLADVQDLPPPQKYRPSSRAALLEAQRPTGSELHLYGVLLGYSRVHHVLHLTRLATLQLRSNPFSFAAMGLARDALDYALRNRWIFDAGHFDQLLGRTAGALSASLEAPTLRRRFLASVGLEAAVRPLELTHSWLRNQLNDLGIANVEQPNVARWQEIAGDPESPPVSGSRGLATRFGGEDLDARYRFLSGYTHGGADAMISAVLPGHLIESAARGKIRYTFDIAEMVAGYASLADSCEWVVTGLYRHLDWDATPVIAAAAAVRRVADFIFRAHADGNLHIEDPAPPESSDPSGV